MTLSAERADPLLTLICRATLGAAIGDLFYSDLIRFQKQLERQRRPRVSRAAIRLWQRGATPRRGPAIDFLARYLAWSKGLQDITTWDAARQAAFEDANLLIAKLNPFLTDDGKAPRPATVGEEPLDFTLSAAMQTLVSISQRSTQQESEAFFRGAKPEAVDDASYFLCYRYSTNNGALVKSFMVIRKPWRDTRTTHVFNDFSGGGIDERFIDHLYRESEGVIFKMERGYYFLGSNYNVPVDKKIDPDNYQRQRREARWRPNGLTVHTFEYDDIHLGPGLFGGLTLSVADLAQPLVARCAMLHLGVKSLLGLILHDDLVQPGEMSPDLVASDLAAIVSRLEAEGCRRFGHQIEKLRRLRSTGPDRFARISASILRMLDNTPAWEAKLAAEADPKPPPHQARGALETFALTGRPRD